MLKIAAATKPKKITHKKAKKKSIKLPAPDESDPSYKFYVSLFRQNPMSQMAIRWLLEHNLGHIVINFGVSNVKLKD